MADFQLPSRFPGPDSPQFFDWLRSSGWTFQAAGTVDPMYAALIAWSQYQLTLPIDQRDPAFGGVPPAPPAPVPVTPTPPSAGSPGEPAATFPPPPNVATTIPVLPPVTVTPPFVPPVGPPAVPGRVPVGGPTRLPGFPSVDALPGTIRGRAATAGRLLMSNPVLAVLIGVLWPNRTAIDDTLCIRTPSGPVCPTGLPNVAVPVPVPRPGRRPRRVPGRAPGIAAPQPRPVTRPRAGTAAPPIATPKGRAGPVTISRPQVLSEPVVIDQSVLQPSIEPPAVIAPATPAATRSRPGGLTLPRSLPALSIPRFSAFVWPFFPSIPRIGDVRMPAVRELTNVWGTNPLQPPAEEQWPRPEQQTEPQRQPLTEPQTAPVPLTQAQADEDACKRVRQRSKRKKSCRNPVVRSRTFTKGNKRFRIITKELKCPESSRRKPASARARRTTTSSAVPRLSTRGPRVSSRSVASSAQRVLSSRFRQAPRLF